MSATPSSIDRHLQWCCRLANWCALQYSAPGDWIGHSLPDIFTRGASGGTLPAAQARL